MAVKRYISRVAVFDLDGTLYKKNSHIEILCYFYKNNVFKSIIFKLIGKLFPKAQLGIMNFFYKRIPYHIKQNFLLSFSKPVIDLLNKKKELGFYPLIISNAPIELIRNAADYLKVDFLAADHRPKQEVLLDYCKFEYLMTCTDNKTDIQLLQMSDEVYITCHLKNKKYFQQYLRDKKINFFNGDCYE